MKESEPRLLPIPPLVWSHHKARLTSIQKRWIEDQKFPPVLLLTGIEGIGKRTIAHFLAQWIFCHHQELKQPFEPCGKCQSCLCAINGSWVNFLEIKVERSPKGTRGHEDSENAPLKIDRFRELKEGAGFGAFGSSHRFILISNAERMTPQAANSILKFLEEPPKGWIFILTSRDSSLLLPTLVSRCQILRLKPFSNEEILSLLEPYSLPVQKKQLCAQIAEGSWGTALNLVQSELWELRPLIFEFLRSEKSGFAKLHEWILAEPYRLEFFLRVFKNLILDLVRWSLGSDGVSDRSRNYSPFSSEEESSSLRTHIQNKFKTFAIAGRVRLFWLDRVEQLTIAESKTHLPLNKKIMVQDLLLQWISKPANPLSCRSIRSNASGT